MSHSLAERLFGISFKPEPASTVRELLHRVRAAAGQTGDVAIARRDDTVSEAYQLFENADLHHLPVLAGNQLVGIVSAVDLLRCFARHESSHVRNVRLEEVMTRDPEVIAETAAIGELVRRLAHAPFRCLPVVSEQGAFVDIVTTRDLVRFLELTME